MVDVKLKGLFKNKIIDFILVCNNNNIPLVLCVK